MMKPTLNNVSVIALISILLFNISCRKEEFDFLEDSTDQTLEADSPVANLLLRTTMNDGSVDNIIDNASCFSLELPFTVTANGTQVNVENEDDYDVIEAIFDESLVDTNTIELEFPVTLVFSDYSTTIINDQAGFDSYVENCSIENEQDDDIECVDIDYPILISVFNTVRETLNTLTFQNDRSLYEYVSTISDNDIANIQFPVGLRLSDGTTLEAADQVALEDYIETYKDSCDEDDDNDFDDDDCTNCDPSEFEDLITSCTVWNVNQMRRENENLTNLYDDFVFTFQMDGTILVTSLSSDDEYLGTWNVSGSGNDMKLEINIAALEDFNGIWDVNESAAINSQGMVNIRMGSDALRFQNGC